MNVACIYRECQFSPNMVDKDRAILDAVVSELTGMGHHLCDDVSDADAVFSMSRSAESLSVLTELEGRGIKVVNSAHAVSNCSRCMFTQMFIDHSVPMPESRVINARTMAHDLSYPLWVKRGEGCAQLADDVVMVRNEDELNRAVETMRGRGYESVVLAEHAVGDLVKFYGVRGTGFFRWYYASEGHSKFGLERENGKEQGYGFSVTEMQRICEHAADVLSLDVYGGDCVVDAGGKIKIIDFNDWPSFSRFRDEAARAIALLVRE